MGKLNESSLKKLEQVDERLGRVIKLGVLRLGFDCVVSEGLRSKEQAILNYCKGRTKAELEAVGVHKPPLPGPKITWTLHSKHVEGKAVDLYPLKNGKLADGGKDLAMYDEMYHGVMAAAAELRIRIRYGGDWDQDGKLREKGETDSVHFELS